VFYDVFIGRLKISWKNLTQELKMLFLFLTSLVPQIKFLGHFSEDGFASFYFLFSSF